MEMIVFLHCSIWCIFKAVTSYAAFNIGLFIWLGVLQQKQWSVFIVQIFCLIKFCCQKNVKKKKILLVIWNDISWTLTIKCFIKENKTGIINACLVIIFFYHIFQEIELFNIKPFYSLWKKDLQISNNCLVVELCEYKEIDNQIIWNCNYPKFSYKFVITYTFWEDKVREFSFMIIPYMFII